MSMVIHPPLTLHVQRDCSIMRGEEEATPPSKTIKKDTSVDEEDPHLGRRENGLRSIGASQKNKVELDR